MADDERGPNLFVSLWRDVSEHCSRKFWTYLLARRNPDFSWPQVFACRWRGHPAGVVYFNAGAYEPDMTCKGCGDDLA